MTFCDILRHGRPALFGLLLLALTFPAQAFAATDPYSPVLKSVRDEVVARTEGELSSYSFTLKLDPDARTVSGTERIDYINATGHPQSTIQFRLYPNADYYNEGGLEIARVRVDDQPVEPVFSAQDTIMSIPLDESVKPGGRLELEIRFTTTVPVDSTGTFGIFSHDLDRGTWMLADWYPILAGWDPESGLVLDPPSPLGDPTFSDAALYELTVTIPEGWLIAASGTEKPGKPVEGVTKWKVVSGPVREMTMVIDDDFQTLTREVDGTTLTLYTNGDGAALAGGELALDEAAAVLAVYSDLLGTYPYDELDLVETEMNAALGVSWTGLVFLNGERFLSSSFFVDEQPSRLRFTVAHEIGHQWWGALVGINSNQHTFLLEGLTNYLAVVAVEQTEGQAAADEQLLVQCVQPYLNALESSGDGPADLSIHEEATGASRGSLVYGKAALGFLAIRREIGDEAFFSAIAAWADEFAFGVATPNALLAAFETESDSELDDLWNFWFEEASTTAADVEALLD